VTPEGRRLLEIADATYLASAICAHVKYTGEQLMQLKTRQKEKKLLEIANKGYGMRWEGLSQIRERNKWFKQLGLVESEPHVHEYWLTEAGREFLDLIEPIRPEEIVAGISIEEDDEWLPDEWALDLCNMSSNELIGRHVPIGRLPGGKERIVSLLAMVASFLAEPKEFTEYDEFLARQGIRVGSLQTFRSVAKRLGIVKFGVGGYRTTTDALVWSTKGRAIDLACIVHANLAYTFEILRELLEGGKNRRELAARAETLYGVKLSPDSLACRLEILECAGLIATARSVIEITDRGKHLLPLVLGSVVTKQKNVIEQKDYPAMRGNDIPSSVLEAVSELLSTAKDSSHPQFFEIACEKAFAMLGFDSEHIGGSGNTDVLIRGQVGTGEEYAVAVDSKSSVAASVDRNIDFVALESHRKKHGAVYSLVVGSQFGSFTLQGTYAKKNGVTFMTVDILCELLKRHASTPISTREYRSLFDKKGLVTSDDVGSLFIEPFKRQRIIWHVINTLSSTIVLNDYEGVFSVRDFRASMIGFQGSYLPSTTNRVPTEAEIREVFDFLSQPMVALLEKCGHGFRLIGSLDDLSTKLSCYMGVRIRANGQLSGEFSE